MLSITAVGNEAAPLPFRLQAAASVLPYSQRSQQIGWLWPSLEANLLKNTAQHQRLHFKRNNSCIGILMCSDILSFLCFPAGIS